jgi:hypothetical protein
MRRRPIALFFGYTSCPSICPTTLLQISSSLEQLGTRANTLSRSYFVSVDPSVDTPVNYPSTLAISIDALLGNGTENRGRPLGPSIWSLCGAHKSNGNTRSITPRQSICWTGKGV